jgi:ADP-ribose pyrophosphatase YjhB (NUDIX family)
MPERLPSPRYCQICGRFLVERYVEAERRTRLQCEGCGFIHYLNPRVVAAIIVSNRGRVLLQQRAVEPRAGFWTFPGGFLEIGETVEEGAARETLEEVGLEVTPERIVGVYSRPQVGIVLVAYEAESASDAAFVGDTESQQVQWFERSDIPWADLAFETTEAALRDWLAQRAFVQGGRTDEPAG